MAVMSYAGSGEGEAGDDVRTSTPNPGQAELEEGGAKDDEGLQGQEQTPRERAGDGEAGFGEEELDLARSSDEEPRGRLMATPPKQSRGGAVAAWGGHRARGSPLLRKD